MKRVFIAEKPSVAAAIAKQLHPNPVKTTHYYDCGDDKVTWCFGHLLRTAPPEAYDDKFKSWSLASLPIVPEVWKMEEDPGKRSQLHEMKKLMLSSDMIVHAGDPDREGQLVVDEIIEHYKIRKNVTRLWLNAIDPASVKKAIHSLEPNSKYRGFMQSALGRQRADWLIGLNMTRLISSVWSSRGGKGIALAVGRVQTPTLAIVVNRDRDIAAFTPHDYYTLTFIMNGKEINNLPVRWIKVKGEDKATPGRCDDEGRIIQKSFMEGVAASLTGAMATVDDVVGEDHSESAPLPFSLSELQKEANKKYGFSPKEVLLGCQELYETHTLTTYPRTDCGYLKESQHAEAAEVIRAIKNNLGESLKVPEVLDTSRKSKAWNDKKVTAHHGIIPTTYKKDVSKLQDRERKLYDLIVKRYLAQFMPEHEYMRIKITISAKNHELESNNRVVTNIGWKALYGAEEAEEEEAGSFSGEVSPGSTGVLASPEVKRQTTKPPERFTGALLIDAMKNIHKFVTNPAVKAKLKENEGIGTEATRADIIDRLVYLGYMEERKKGKKTEYHSTVLGQLLVDVLPGLFTSPELTAFLESKLAEVEHGKIPISKVEEIIVKLVVAAIEDGKEGVGLEKLNPNLIPADQLERIKQAQAALDKKKAERKNNYKGGGKGTGKPQQNKGAAPARN